MKSGRKRMKRNVAALCQYYRWEAIPSYIVGVVQEIGCNTPEIHLKGGGGVTTTWVGALAMSHPFHQIRPRTR